jgi:hypothetical protein
MVRQSAGFTLAVVLALISVVPGNAQIVAPAGRTLFNKNVMVRCFARVDYFGATANGTDARAITAPCAVVWGFYRDTNLQAVLPLAALTTKVPIGRAMGRTESGLADLQVLVQYDGFYKKNVPKGFTRVGGQFGVKLPTGRAGFSSEATGYFFAPIFSYVRDRHWLVADGQLTLATTNNLGSKQGNRWNYDLAYLYRLLPLRGFEARNNLFLILEGNGEVANRTRIRDTRLKDSGGQTFFLSPGVEFLPTNRWVLEFSVPVPVVRHLNGSQLKPQVSLIAGMRYLL